LTTYTLQLVLLRVYIVQVVWWQHQGTAFPLCMMTVAVTTFPVQLRLQQYVTTVLE